MKKLIAIPVLLVFVFACYHPRTGVKTEVSDTLSADEPNAVPFDQIDIKPQFSELTDEKLAEIEWKLNHRPRKSLGYRTPLEYCKQLFNFDF